MKTGTRNRFLTGVPGLDALLGGGIPARQTMMVTGNPGTGKTLLCSQIAFRAAERGLPVVFGTVTSESHDKLVDELSRFSFFREDFLGEQVFLVSLYRSLQTGTKEARELVLGTVRDRGAKLLFLDDFRSVRDLWRDEARVRDFLYELSIGLAVENCVGIVTTSYPRDQLLTLPEATTADAIISLDRRPRGLRRLRRAEVVKVRGSAHLTGAHLLEITGEGVRVVPRLEAVPPEGDLNRAPDEARKSFGLPGLDTLLDGGLPAASATLLAGSMGIGKTLVSAHFALEGARKGEKALFVSFSEGLGALAARARRIGLDLQPSIANGTFRFVYLPATELDADVVVDRILVEVAQTGVRRLVIDGLGILDNSIAEPERHSDFLAALNVRLRLGGVTTLFTKEVSKIVGAELDFSDTPIAALGENLLLLRYVELRGHIHRFVSVLKMRDSRYDSDLREFEISDEGIRVLAPMRSAHGLLTGHARPMGSGTDEESA